MVALGLVIKWPGSIIWLVSKLERNFEIKNWWNSEWSNFSAKSIGWFLINDLYMGPQQILQNQRQYLNGGDQQHFVEEAITHFGSYTTPSERRGSASATWHWRYLGKASYLVALFPPSWQLETDCKPSFNATQFCVWFFSGLPVTESQQKGNTDSSLAAGQQYACARNTTVIGLLF